MALRALVKVDAARTTSNRALHLFRRVLREVPRVLTIYDLEISVDEARQRVREAFKKSAWVKDERTITILCHKGEVDLDETLLQYKTKSQLMSFLEPRLMTPKQERALSSTRGNAIYRGFSDQYNMLRDKPLL